MNLPLLSLILTEAHMLTTWHHHHLLTPKAELKRLYWSRFALSLAGGLVSIFIPIYLLKNQLSFQNLLAFYCVYAAGNLLFAVPCMKLLVFWGPNLNLALGGVAQFIVYLLLAAYTPDSALVWLIALVAALANELYFPSFHATFSTVENKRAAGQQVGLLTIVVGLAQAVTPLLGGLIALAFGIKALYLPAAVIILAGAVPLITDEKIVKESSFSLKLIKRPTISSDLSAVFGASMVTMAEVIIWPVAIYLLLHSLVLVGGLSTLTLLMSVTVAFYVGKRIERQGTKGYVNRASPLLVFINLCRILANSVLTISGLNLFAGIVGSLKDTAYTTAFYRNAGRSNRLAYLLATELTWHTAWLLVSGFMYFLAASYPPRTVLSMGLLLAAAGGLLIKNIRHT